MENSQTTLATREPQNFNLMQNAMQVADIVAQIRLIQQVMREIMKDGVHYGKTPGCGDKPSLLKPGAELISTTFRLAPYYDVTSIDLPGGHREVRVICTIKQISTSLVFGQGVGSCSTQEGKYRYRTGPVEFTGQPVPREYWDIRAKEPAKAQKMLGGDGRVAAKNPATQAWEIAMKGDKIEHPDPADYYNTVFKMAKKRALVDAVLTCTSASDLFSQDLDDDDEAALHEKESDKGTIPRDEPDRKPKGNGGQQSAPQGQSQSSNQNQGTEAENAQDWREVTIHFGKQSGKQLGELEEKSLQWWCESWVPNPWPANSRSYKANDLFLRKALDNAATEMGFSKPDFKG